jgi:hypothetical protein
MTPTPSFIHYAKALKEWGEKRAKKAKKRSAQF